MKKFLMVLAFAGVSVASMAQDAVPTEKYSVATNSFWSNWFFQAHYQISSFYGNEEVGRNYSLSPVKTVRFAPIGASVAIGKYFTPGLALRTKVHGSIWGRALDTKKGQDDEKDETKYLTLSEQAIFNLSNLLAGYNEDRKFDFSVFAGASVARNFSDDRYAFGLNAGLIAQYKISPRVAVDVELGYYMYEPSFTGNATPLAYDNRGGINRLKRRDHQIALEAGISVNLGKVTWNKVPDVEAIKALSQGQIDALNAQLADANAENARLKDLLAQKKDPQPSETKVVKEVVSAPVSVFFNLNKATVASQKDLQNIQAVADAAKANNAKIVVTGYADSKTGNSEINQTLSQKRADAVADALVNMGVDRANIETVAAGGVDTLSPFSFNRRATVELK